MTAQRMTKPRSLRTMPPDERSEWGTYRADAKWRRRPDLNWRPADYESTQFCVCCCAIRIIAERFGVFLSTPPTICTVHLVQQHDQPISDRLAWSFPGLNR